MPETLKSPDPTLLASLSEDIEAGRLADADTLIAQLETEGYGGDALAAVKDRLVRGHFANALTAGLKESMAKGLPVPMNRAQRRSEVRKKRKK